MKNVVLNLKLFLKLELKIYGFKVIIFFLFIMDSLVFLKIRNHKKNF